MQLNATLRPKLGKRSRRFLREGKLPAIVYGYNTEPTPITLDRLEFQKVFSKSGRTHLVDLAITDGEAARSEKVLVRDIQVHPRRLGPIHVDLYQPNLQEKIEVEVPVRLTGESGPVKQGDGDILQPLHSIRVESLPSEIPESFEVDISPLDEIEAELRVKDLSVPKGVTVLEDPEELVVKIVHKRELKIEEEVPAAEAAVPAEGEAATEGEAAAAEQAETEE